MSPDQDVVKYRAMKVNADGSVDVRQPFFEQRDFGGADFDTLDELAEHYRKFVDGYRRRLPRLTPPRLHVYKVTYHPLCPMANESETEAAAMTEAMPYLTRLAAKLKEAKSLAAGLDLIANAVGADAFGNLERLMCEQAEKDRKWDQFKPGDMK